MMKVTQLCNNAIVVCTRTGKTLFSYETPVLRVDKNGQMWRLWDGWSRTTGRHIKQFCDLFADEYIGNKEYVNLPFLDIEKEDVG